MNKVQAYRKAYYENRKEYFRQYSLKHKVRLKALWSARYQAKKQEILAKQKIYRRQHTLNLGNNHIIYGLNKAPYPINGRCPYCRRDGLRLGYHHWSNVDFNDGVWLCCRCHIRLELLIKSMPFIASKLIASLKTALAISLKVNNS